MMSIKPENILRHELIGLKAIIARSTNPFLTGTRGQIIDETRNTLKLKTEKGVKVVPKVASVFRLTLPDASVVEVEGAKLVGKPENRIKTRARKW